MLKNANEAARLVLRLANEAARKGTFGVGGAIVDNCSGRVIKALPNHVLTLRRSHQNQNQNQNQNQARGRFVQAPLAHAERRLVEWYYAHQARLKLPPPACLTIISSLDPCAMCAGTLLAAGFNVGVVAGDPWAGINWDHRFEFRGLPAGLQFRLKQHFGYYAVTGQRDYIGNPLTAFCRTPVAPAIHDCCQAVFRSNLQKIWADCQRVGQPPEKLTDPARLPSAAPVKRACQRYFSGAFAHRLTDYRTPDERIRQILLRLVNTTTGAENAVALIDPFGNLVMAAPDTFHVSPIATAFSNLIGKYSRVGDAMRSQPAVSQATRPYLTHPRHGTIVFLFSPEPHKALTLADLGAYGSTMEGPLPVTRPGNFQYFHPHPRGTLAELQEMINALPPFYNQTVGLEPQPVAGYGTLFHGAMKEE